MSVTKIHLKEVPEGVEVGTCDYTKKRWSKKVVKRKVANQRHYGYQRIGGVNLRIQQGKITFNKQPVTVYQRDDQRYWTMFWEEVMR